MNHEKHDLICVFMVWAGQDQVVGEHIVPCIYPRKLPQPYYCDRPGMMKVHWLFTQ